MQNRYEVLQHRRQFILGQNYTTLPSWKRTEVRPQILLSTHPDLPVEQVKKDNTSITLLGFILDADNPHRKNNEILLGLMPPLFGDHDPTFKSTPTLGGRWILIVDNGEDVEIFGDCFGMKTVFHTQGKLPWCGSQLGVLQQQLGLPLDPEALSYQEACLKAGQVEYWFPNTSTLCKEVKCLLPNHALNLVTGKVRRFWPQKGIAKTSLRHAVKIGGHLLSGLMEAVAERSKMMIFISAGLDSRLVLAAARKVKDSMPGLTYISDGMDPDDVAVPSLLLPKVGIPHKVIDCRSEMSEEFSEAYISNTVPAHAAYGKIAFGIQNSASEPFLQVNGSGGEILRAYGHEYGGRKIDADYLLVNFLKHPFAFREIKEWLDSVADVQGIDIMDLFYIEQRMGRWCTEGYTEWDIVNDCFTPFNCRAVIETLKGVNENYQREPETELIYSLIRSLWPEILSVPINPHKKHHRQPQPRSLKQTIKNRMIRSHLLDYFPTRLIDSAKKLLP